MSETNIYSTGHGNKGMDEFLSEIKSFGITHLMDVRSKPYSKWNPAFNKDPLEAELEKNGIRYVFAGDTLGGMPEDKSCYDHQGKVLYEHIKEKEFFKTGLEKLISAHREKSKLVIMCSEANPAECHRTKLIGQELLKKGISLQHIIAQNRAKSQETVMAELTKGKGTIDLFGNETEFTSRKSH